MFLGERPSTMRGGEMSSSMRCVEDMQLHRGGEREKADMRGGEGMHRHRGGEREKEDFEIRKERRKGDLEDLNEDREDRVNRMKEMRKEDLEDLNENKKKWKEDSKDRWKRM